MRFPLKLALSAVLAKTIAAELNHMAQNQQVQNELDANLQGQQSFRQAVKTELSDDAPKSAFSGFQSQDPVQQYATSYNGDKDGINAEPSNQYPTYLDPTLPYNGYSGIVPYAAGNGYNPNVGGYNSGAFAVQSGYEGYLVPGPPQAPVAPKKEVSSRSSVASLFGPLSSTFSALSRSLPENPFSFLLGIVGATVFGGGITTLLCTFTPFCSITFPFLPFRSGLKSLAKTYVGPENAELLEKAIDKFSNMQTEERANAAAKSDDAVVESVMKVVSDAPKSIVDAPKSIADAPKSDISEKSTVSSTTK